MASIILKSFLVILCMFSFLMAQEERAPDSINNIGMSTQLFQKSFEGLRIITAASGASDFKKIDNFPELITESMLLELISLINYDLESAFQKTETDFDTIEKLDGEELNQLFSKWKHSIFLYGWGSGINYIRKDLESFIEFCESHNLNLYLEKLKYLINQFEMKLTNLIEKKSKGRGTSLLTTLIFQYLCTFSMTSLDFSWAFKFGKIRFLYLVSQHKK